MDSIIDIILLIAVLIGIFYTFIETTILTGERYISRRQKRTSSYPPVSIFKPLKGIDSQLEENLRTFFEQDYEKFELLFGVNDDDDPAIEIVRKLQRTYPHIQTRLVVNEFRIGPNPKVNNLHNMYPYAHYDYFIISDSNVQVKQNYIKSMMHEMSSEKIGLVTSLIRGTGANNISSLFENLHLNSYIAGNIIAVKRLFGISVTIGKSMLFRREIIEKIGGFKVLGRFLAEDHMIGQSVLKLGYKTRISKEPIDTINAGWKFGQFCNRHLRWAAMRKHVNFAHYIGEIFSNPILFAVIYYLQSPSLLGFEIYTTVFFTKSLLDYTAAKSINAEEKWYYYLLVPVKDLIMVGLWIVPFFKNTINWRGNKFIISKNTELTPVAQSFDSFEEPLSDYPL